MSANFRGMASRLGERQFNSHDNRTEGGRRRGRGSSRGRYGPKSFRGRNAWKRTDGLKTDTDGDVSMGEGSANEGRRGGRGRAYRGRQSSYHDRPPTRRSNREGDRSNGLFTNAVQGIRGGRSAYHTGRAINWFMVTLLRGKSYGKHFLITSLDKHLEEPIEPTMFHIEGQNSVFYVKDKEIADALRSLTKRIQTPDGSKMVILVKSCQPPVPQLNEENLEKLKVCMSERYDAGSKCLDLQNLYNDSRLSAEGLYLPLGRPEVMLKVFEIIEENIPEIEGLSIRNNRLFHLINFSRYSSKIPSLTKLDVSKNELKTTYELKKISDLKITELVLEGNPMCSEYKDKDSLVSAVKNIFPKLEKLDGVELPPAIVFDLETPTDLPKVQGSVFFSDEAKDLIVKFVKEYFTLYDAPNSKDRQALLDAYHNDAVFSLTSVQNNTITYSQPYGLGEYIARSRNLKRNDISSKMEQKLHKGKLNVVATLADLPATTHDLNTFVVDVMVAENTTLSFTLTGVFKESDENKPNQRPRLRNFSRVFVCVPQGSGIVISNEMMFVSNVHPDNYKKYFQSTAPTPSSSPTLAGPQGATPTTDELKSLEVEKFAKASTMNLDFSRKCLEEHKWNFAEAADTFTKFHTEGKIPPQAFIW